MPDILPLPLIMVAPNGARRTKKDHAALPITIAQTVATAIECKRVGADGLHLHIRDKEGQHILDAGLYREAFQELDQQLPGFYVQMTTEAMGLYSPMEQIQLVKNVHPKAVSVSIAELLSQGEGKEAIKFYRWCIEANIAVQHILYSAEDLARIEKLNLLRLNAPIQLIFVLGRYTQNRQSKSNDLNPFLQWISRQEAAIDWAVCAFGKSETDCLIEAFQRGGKVRVGFENSLWHRDGSLAEHNQARVAEIAKLIEEVRLN